MNPFLESAGKAGARRRVAAIGECMMEFSPRGDGLYRLGYAGDTLNTAVYLARLGVAVDYVTALGDDRFSDQMIAAWKEEGVGTELVARVAGRLPGMYLIDVDPSGERRFHYWREGAPVRELLRLPEAGRIAGALEGYDVIVLSGITLSRFDEDGQGLLLGAIDACRSGGGVIVFDGNFRPRAWPEREAARRAVAAMVTRVDVSVTGFEDEASLFGDADPFATRERLLAAGVREIVVKQGPKGALVAWNGESEVVAAEPVASPVDTTAAGDAFNAGYVAARLSGRGCAQAARAGHHLAAAVIRHPGAIIPARAMPAGMADYLSLPKGSQQ